MTNIELGLTGEGWVAKKLEDMEVKYWWNPSQRNYYGADFLTNYGIIDVKTAKPQTKHGRICWCFNCHHHGVKQEFIDIFIFIIIGYKDSKLLYFIMPKELCKKQVFTISERQIENGRYSYFLDAWDIIINKKPKISIIKPQTKNSQRKPRIKPERYNFPLYNAIKDAGSSQKKLAEQTGIPKARIGYIINGKWNTSDEEKGEIETALGKKIWKN